MGSWSSELRKAGTPWPGGPIDPDWDVPRVRRRRRPSRGWWAELGTGLLLVRFILELFT